MRDQGCRCFGFLNAGFLTAFLAFRAAIYKSDRPPYFQFGRRIVQFFPDCPLSNDLHLRTADIADLLLGCQINDLFRNGTALEHFFSQRSRFS